MAGVESPDSQEQPTEQAKRMAPDYEVRNPNQTTCGTPWCGREVSGVQFCCLPCEDAHAIIAQPVHSEACERAHLDRTADERRAAEQAEMDKWIG